jgi:hypothetical protein
MSIDRTHLRPAFVAAAFVVTAACASDSEPDPGDQTGGSSGIASGGKGGASAGAGRAGGGGASGSSGTSGAAGTGGKGGGPPGQAGASGFSGSAMNGGAGSGGTTPAGGFSGATAAGAAGAGAGSGGVPPNGGSSNGGSSESGASAGGASNAGASNGGGGTGAGGGGGSGAGGSGGEDDWYPCDGETSGYDALVTNSNGTWTALRGANSVYTGSDMRAAVQAGIDSLTPNRTSKESVLVQGSGSMSANSRINLASFTILNVCGTIDVTGSGSGDQAPLYARGRTDIDVPHVNISGAPLYALFFRDVENLHLGQVDLRVSGGLGVRIDNHGRSDRSDKVENIRIDSVYAEGTSSHGVETYGVDQLTIGSVIARNTGECGLLLNDTTNAEIGLVDAEDAGTGTGYAAFRMANRNGRIGDAYPTNVHVGQVIARGGGRGVFCVSESGGAVIDRIDLSDTGNNAILLENCYNVTIAGVSGSVTGGGDVRISARDEFENSSDITIQNLTITDSALVESPCADGSVFQNNMLVDSSMNVCP